MATKLITNYQYRAIKYFDELTDKEKKQALDDYDLVDYIETSFFTYRGYVYSFDDIIKQKVTFEGITFDGVISESAFSSVVIKLNRCGDSVMIGRVIS